MDPRRPHRVRLGCVVALGVTGFLMWASIGRRWTAWLDTGWYATLSNGEVRVGRSLPPRNPLVRLDWSVTPSWSEQVVAAWRPYRTSMHAMDSGVALPLWQPLAASGLGAAFAHGYLRGLRRRSDRACVCCGYPTAGLPFVNGERACPECGRRERADGAWVVV